MTTQNESNPNVEVQEQIVPSEGIAEETLVNNLEVEPVQAAAMGESSIIKEEEHLNTLIKEEIDAAHSSERISYAEFDELKKYLEENIPRYPGGPTVAILAENSSSDLMWSNNTRNRIIDRKKFNQELNTCPEMHRDNNKWMKAKEQFDYMGKDSPMVETLFQTAEWWARLMQKDLDSGMTLEECAKSNYSKVADTIRIAGELKPNTLNEWGMVADIISKNWDKSEDFSAWATKNFDPVSSRPTKKEKRAATLQSIKEGLKNFPSTILGLFSIGR